MSSKFKEIKKFIQKECRENGVRFYHGRGTTVMFHSDKVRSNGYFSEEWDGSPPTLAIATNVNTLDTMIHEYCHMKQFLESHPTWTALASRGQMWNWLAGIDYPDDVITESVYAYMNVEIDCEIRAVKFHQEWETGINIEEYIQKANAYTLFYRYLRDYRKWYEPQYEPYSLESVWRNMPTTFDFDHQAWYNNHIKIFSQCIKER